MAASPKAVKRAARQGKQTKQGRKDLKERMQAVVQRLEREATDRVGKKQPIEQRWLDDVRQYHGQYTGEIEQSLKDAKKSTLYVNQTRQKTNAMEARLSDMLFPTDDRNWGINPSPVPELTVEAEEAARRVLSARTAAVANPQDPQLAAAADEADQALAALQAEMEEARKRARLMQEEIDDHLRASKYAATSREIIRDACRLGTGVIKGPMADSTRPSWQREQGSNVYRLTRQNRKRPAYYRVDPWNFFPDPDATCMEESDSNFERHLLTAKKLRAKAKEPGFDKDAIRRLLAGKPDSGLPTYLTDLRSITSSNVSTMGERYHVWEYHGPLEPEDLETLIEGTGRQELAEDVAEIDPLQEINVVLWFCQGELLKVGLHHLDSGEPVYSVFNLDKDDASIWGFGIPYILRDPQKAIAAAWRTLMDNMGLSSGPQIVIDERCIEPVNGQWALEPRKAWRKKADAPPGAKPFETFDIPSYMAEILKVIEVAKEFVDEESALPMLAQGDQATHVTKTAGGMSILMNAVNIVFRRIVKNWDDDLTTPVIRRTYDWLMQFSPKDYIKGDYDIEARGTSVLLVREMQSANLLSFLVHFGAPSPLSQFLKEGGLPALRRLAQVLMIPADEVIKTDSEVKEDQAKAAQRKTPNPEMEKLAVQLNLEEIRGRNAMQVESMRQETALMELAQTHNMELDKLRAMLLDQREARASKERIMAAEAAVEERLASQQRAHEKDQQAGQEKRSGGYF